MPYADPQKNKDYHRNYSKTWDADHPEQRHAIQARHDQKRNGTSARKQQLSDVRRRRHVRQRLAVILRYGGCCAFCGTTQYEHLTIDHINGGGIAHFRELARSNYRGLVDFLYRTEFRPDLYRVLCRNCHMAMTRHNVQPDGEELHDLAWWEEYSALRRAPNTT